MRKYLTEFIGTFALVFTVGCAVLIGNPLAPLAIGAVLMVMVYAGGHISGAHYNPAVTLGVLLRGKMPTGDVLPYWVAQLFAAFIAAWLARFVINPKSVQAAYLGNPHRMVAVLLAEFIFTFLLVYVVLNVATSKDQPNNQFFGLAIGFTAAAGAFAVGTISGGAFNPAVVFGAMLMGLINWTNFWIYLIANLLGGAVAAVAFRYLNPDDAGAALPKLPKIPLTKPTAP
jgi:aquaporin Z